MTERSHERKVSPIGNDNGLENYTRTHNHMGVLLKIYFLRFPKRKNFFTFSPQAVRTCLLTKRTHASNLIAIGCELALCACVCRGRKCCTSFPSNLSLLN